METGPNVRGGRDPDGLLATASLALFAFDPGLPATMLAAGELLEIGPFAPLGAVPGELLAAGPVALSQDKIVSFDKAFTREQPPPPKVRRAPKPVGPIKVMSR